MQPWIIAHRGGAQLAPENTLAAFTSAVHRGCDGAELDVQLSRDGRVIVHHDFRLKEGLCRRKGRWIVSPTALVKDLTLGELRDFDVGRAQPGSTYAREHAAVAWRDGEPIPLLEEVIAVAKTAPKPFHLFVELKTSFADSEASAGPEELAERSVAAIEEHDYANCAVFVGFDWRGLIRAKALAPHVRCWFTSLPSSWFGEGTPPPEDDPPPGPALQMLRLWARTGTSPWAAGHDAVRHGGSIIAAIKAAGGDGWFPYWRDVTAAAVREARILGLKIGCWTVNGADAMHAVAALGVDAICTDRPDLWSGRTGS
ncbi:MAG: hypothetical protein KGJ78_01550 [Alphaproteobacteria bacterium]|nr:hypothetical protein [Alphaproteobacteria bacterium]